MILSATRNHGVRMLCMQKNFGKPVEWALVKEYPWSTPQLRKISNDQGTATADAV